MRAVGYQFSLPVEDSQSLMDIEIEKPVATGYDLLIAVKAISVNPVDTKVRKRAQPSADEYKVLGWDASGVVVATGDQVTQFNIGDEVFYAGDITRSGSNAEYHLVDERIVGFKPKTLSFEQAAALPLTSLTAWEVLFDRLTLNMAVAGGNQHILVIGGAGGVSSMAIQLLRALTNFTVIATASRPESKVWVEQLGAHYVLDHTQSLAQQISSLGLPAPELVFSTTHSDQYIQDIAALILPQGRFALIDDPAQLDISVFKQKSTSIHWESMYTRSTFQTADMHNQSAILNQVAALVDQGKIKSTQSQHFGKINAENLRAAHTLLESHRSIGKIVLSDF
jgi:NADPH2:quinone reductase